MNTKAGDLHRLLLVAAASFLLAGCGSSIDDRTITKSSSFSTDDPDGLIVASFRNRTTFGVRYVMIWRPFDPATGRFTGTLEDALIIRGHYGSMLVAPPDDGYDDKRTGDMVSRIHAPLGSKEYMIVAAKPGTYGLYLSTHSHIADLDSGRALANYRHTGKIQTFTIQAGQVGYLGDFVLWVGAKAPDGRTAISNHGQDLETAYAALDAYKDIEAQLEPLDLRSLDGAPNLKTDIWVGPEPSDQAYVSTVLSGVHIWANARERARKRWLDRLPKGKYRKH